MIRISLRDLQWRRRRFVIVVLVAALAFGLALTMTGVTHQLSQEGVDTVALFGADEWLVPTGGSGPFTSSQLLDRSEALASADQPGVVSASPLLLGRVTIDQRDVNIVGYDPASAMLPERLVAARSGHDHPEGAIVDVTLRRNVGDAIEIGGRQVPIVAQVTDTAFYFSSPTVFLPIAEVQQLLFAGQDVASTVTVIGHVDQNRLGDSIGLLTSDDVLADFERVIKSSADTIGIVNILLWSMAAGIVAAIVFVSVLERTADFATLKAMGTSDRSLVVGLIVQAGVVSLLSAAASVGVSRLISPAFGFPVSIPSSAYIQLVVVALVVGVLSSLVAVRRVIRIDPVLAFGGAS